MTNNSIIIGILGFQGDFLEHQQILNQLGVKTIIIKNKIDLEKIDGLIIPGGESTTIKRFIEKKNMLKPLKKFILEDKKYVMGTCAGAIILSKKTVSKGQIVDGIIPAMDIVTERNSYGSQINSFIKTIKLKEIGEYNCIFIRAPKILKVNHGIVFGYENNNPIMVRNENILICTFHPELENSDIHKYFLDNLFK